MLLHMVFSTRCCGCDPEEPVCSLVHCVPETSRYIYDNKSQFLHQFGKGKVHPVTGHEGPEVD